MGIALSSTLGFSLLGEGGRNTIGTEEDKTLRLTLRLLPPVFVAAVALGVSRGVREAFVVKEVGEARTRVVRERGGLELGETTAPLILIEREEWVPLLLIV